MVVLNDVNVGDVPDLIEYAGRNNVVLQLIELDPVNVGDKYYVEHHRSLDEQEAMSELKPCQSKNAPSCTTA